MIAQSGSSLGDVTREMLLRERAAVMARMDAVTRDALDTEIDTDGVPPSGFEREHAIRSMLDGRLLEIESALKKIDAGVYGVCAECHNPIPPKRLEALPFATLCVSCQSVADKKARRQAVR